MRRRLMLLMMLVLLIGLSPAAGAQKKAGPYMKVHFINVGQGDSTLIETPNGKKILIDGGPPEAGTRILEYLREHRIHKLDLLIATHPDVDHIGGLVTVIPKIKIKRVLDSGKLHSTQTYKNYLKLIRKNKIPFDIATQNEFIEIDPAITIQVLNAYDRAKENNNEASIVLKLEYKEIDFLLMADAEIEQEKEIMKQYDMEAEILKVGHHGSNTSTSYNFLQAVRPQTAILTYHVKNHYGHPVSRVVRNLWRIKADIYSTAVFGNLVIRTNGEHYFIMPEKSPLDHLREK